MRFFIKGELKLLWPFYLAIFIGYLVNLTSFIFAIYFLDKGFTFFEVSIFMGIFFFANFLFEVPTGAIADVFGRKVSVISGWVLGGLSFCIIPFFDSFWGIFFILLVFGVSFTLCSGAYEAWVVDYLKKKKRNDLVDNYFVNDSSLASMGTFFAGLFGVLIISLLDFDWLFYIEGAGMFFAAFILLLAESDEVHKKYVVKKTYLETIKRTKESFFYVKKNIIIKNLILASFFYMMFGIAGVTWQPLLIEGGFPKNYLTLLGSVGAFLAIFIPRLVKPLSKFGNKNNILSILILLMSLFLMSLSFLQNLILILLVFLSIHFILPTIHEIIENQYFQKNSKTKIRSTLVSIKSMADSIPLILAYIFGGLLADFFGIRISFLISGILMLPAIYFYFKAK